MSKSWKSFWSEHAKNSLRKDSNYQVLRTINKKPVSKAQFHNILKDIENKLKISSNDNILDLCCGNVLITRHIASKCKHVIGVDFVKELVSRTNLKDCNNLSLLIGDANNVQFKQSSFDKIIIYAGLQYFSYRDIIYLFESAKRWLKIGGIFFIGDIPNKNRIWHFFNTYEREQIYFKSIKNKEKIIGAWFEPEWLAKLGRYCKYSNVDILNQSKILPYSHYRFDIILQK